MPSYIIVFELKRRRKSYTDLEERLAKFDTCWQVRDCVWIVVSNGTNDDLHSALKPSLGAEDELFIARIGEDNTWSGYGQRVSAWLSNNLSNRN